MNKKQRIKIRAVQDTLREGLSVIRYIKDEQTTALNNIPENLQDGKRYSAIEDAVDKLEDACDNIEQAIEDLNEASV